MRIRLRIVAVLAVAGCTSATGSDGQAIERSYAVYAVNGNSPDAKTFYSAGGDRISIPRGDLLLHKDGTVEERLQYVIYFPNGVINVAATDTVIGHYEWNQTQYDVRMPTATGSELLAGAVYPDADLVLLDRSWVKNGVTVKVTITYARN
jgi:hypothetical protein